MSLVYYLAFAPEYIVFKTIAWVLIFLSFIGLFVPSSYKKDNSEINIFFRILFFTFFNTINLLIMFSFPSGVQYGFLYLIIQIVFWGIKAAVWSKENENH